MAKLPTRFETAVRAARAHLVRLEGWLSAYRLPLSMVAFNVTGAASLVWLCGWRGVSATDLVVFGTMYLLGVIGLEIGMHRYFSHRAFEVTPALRNALVILGSMGGQGSALVWATNHRKHHRFADQDGDPHSPRPRGEGRIGVLRGLVHGHFTWHFAEATSMGMRDLHRYGRDLVSDRDLMRVDRYFWRWVALGMVVPAIAGLAVTRTLDGAFTAFLWGGPVRVFAVDNAIWMINSVAHSCGPAPFDARDRSRNVWWLVVPLLGGGWHNTHHAFPGSARMALLPGQIDPGFWIIRALECLGQAHSLRVAQPRGDSSPPAPD